jgi:tetratricopeptide (TPR) repeat protein
MAEVASYAQELDMEGEFRALVGAALKLDDADGNPDYWNWLGCIMDRVGWLDLALACFLEALQKNPSWELGRKNAWLVGRSLIKRKLASKEFKDSLEDIDKLMIHSDGIEAEDRAYMMAATGLCCEGLGLLEEAEQRYRMAFEIMGDCLVARFGANRVTSEDDTERVRYFNLQLASFPRIPHELGVDDKVPVEFIEGFSHGDHWDAVTSGAKDFITNYLPLAVEKSEPRGFAKYDAASRVGTPADAGFLFAYPSEGVILGGILIMATPFSESKEVWSAYPYVTQGDSVRFEVVSLEEWSNGVEGSVVVHRGGGGDLTFFDPFFFENKNIYRNNHEYEYILSGFACKIKKTEQVVHRISSGAAYEMERLRRQEEGDPMQEGDTYDVVIGERSTILSDIPEYPSEYQFFVPVDGVETTEFLGEKIIVIRTHINDEKRAIPLKIFAARHLLEGEIQPGDLVTGYLWLQGFLAFPEGASVDRDETQGEELRWGKISFKKQDSDSVDEELSYVFRQALASIDANRSFVQMPFRVGDEPDYVIENDNGNRFYVRCVHFNLESETWEGKQKCSLDAVEQSQIASQFSPLFILGVGYTKVGEGNAFTYFGWEEFETALVSKSKLTTF